MLEGKQAADGVAEDGAGSISRSAGPRTEEAQTRGAEVAGVEAGAGVFSALQIEVFTNCPRMAGPDLREARTVAASSTAVGGEAMSREVLARGSAAATAETAATCHAWRSSALSGQGCATAASTGEAAPGFREDEGGRRGEPGSGPGCWRGRRWKEIRPAAAPLPSLSRLSRRESQVTCTPLGDYGEG
jgi:hypothetical protein